jgi:DNA invertase Pin-like site-specific DNA recombinase
LRQRDSAGGCDVKRYGYARVSTDDQSLEIQHDLLTKAGCDIIRSEKVSGKSVVRPLLRAIAR